MSAARADIQGEQIPEFLDWFERLEVGVAVGN